MHSKKPSDSRTYMTDMVLPSETNPLNNLFGGELLARMDRRNTTTICGLYSPSESRKLLLFWLTEPLLSISILTVRENTTVQRGSKLPCQLPHPIDRENGLDNNSVSAGMNIISLWNKTPGAPTQISFLLHPITCPWYGCGPRPSICIDLCCLWYQQTGHDSNCEKVRSFRQSGKSFWKN